MSKIQSTILAQALETILNCSADNKRCFNESVELHVNLKNYDTQKDRRFAGRIPLPHVARPTMVVCIIGDAYHYDQAGEKGIPRVNIDDLKKLNKNKKLFRRLFARYDAFIASESLIKTIPRVVGPHMSRCGKFPAPVAHGDDLVAKITDMQSTIKFQLKKVLNLGIVVGHVEMEQDHLRQNVMKSVNFLVSLLKKNWQNIKSLFLKSTFGPVQRIY